MYIDEYMNMKIACTLKRTVIHFFLPSNALSVLGQA